MSSSAKPAANQSTAPAQLYRGIVKQVQSGDCVVIRSVAAKDGKVLEKQLMISNITAPRLAKNTTKNNDATEPDQPYAFEAREFLRKKLVGKEICFVKDSNAQANVERGSLYLGRDPATGENMADALVSAGLVEVRRLTKPSEEENRLVALEDQAKSQGKGKWSKDPESAHIRDMKWTIENATAFVDKLRQKPVEGIIEYVRDGSTFRVLLLPTYHYVTVQLSGIKCPGFKREGDQEVPEQFAEEARFFVESRLLHRDVSVILEGVANQGNQGNGILLGSILHPNGNIAEFLLKDGLAKCVDWSMGVVSSGAEKYRNAEKQAKQAKLRLWKNYKAAASSIDESSKTFSGKVIEVLNGDGIVVKLADGSVKKVFLSSVRPPRQADYKEILAKFEKKNNPIYDVPYLFEAREFLRKKLIGKKVNCTVDYIQPKSDDYPEKVNCTVMFGETNVAEALISQGLAKVIRYKQDDDQRSSKYDELLSAESRAQKKATGVHSPKEPSIMKIADVSGDANKAKQFLPFLQKSDRLDALVEFVSSGSRFRLYMPKETCLITFLLSGIDCPRLGRPASGANAATPNEEFAEEAYAFSKSHCLQREVKVSVEAVDKAGNFIGQLYTDEGVNVSVALVEAGIAAVYKNAGANSAIVAQLSAAEQRAKEKKINRWKNYVEEKVVLEEVEKSEPTERVVVLKKLVVTEITDDLHFYGQLVENGSKLEQLMTQLRAEIEARPPVPGAYTPKVGDVCVAQFSADDEWYRAKVLTAPVNGSLTVLFIDYGNKEKTKTVKLAQIPAGFEALPPQAHEYAFALVQPSSDEDDVEAAVDYLKQLIFSNGPESEFTFNVENKVGSVEFVTLLDSKKNDIGKQLISEGLVSVDKSRQPKRLQKLLNEYLKALSAAKQAHKNMWRYGDKEADDAAEFGLKKVEK